MEREPESLQPLTQYGKQALPGQMVLERHHGVVGMANQLASAFEPRTHHRLEPFIQHVVQVDVGEQRRDHAALRRSASRAAEHALFEHPRLQPLVDHSPDEAVRDSLVEEFPKAAVVDGVEVLGDIDIHHPTEPPLHEAMPQGV